jgi:HEPN domain-containing protein
LAECNLGFSKKLIDAAKFASEREPDIKEAMRTVLYLSKLACEITLKALLEKAGRPIKEIKDHQHDLCKLLLSIGQCKVQSEVTKSRLSTSNEHLNLS